MASRLAVIPIFPVRDMTEAQEFWTSAGVDVEPYDDGYAFVLVDGSELVHLALHPGLDPVTNAAACYVHVSDPAEWHQRLVAAGLPVTELRAEPWGMTEFRVQDPSGNLVRLGRNT